MIVIVSIPGSGLTEVEVDGTDTISVIKRAILIMKGVEEKLQKLVYNGKVLNATDDLTTQGIVENARINLLVEKTGSYISY